MLFVPRMNHCMLSWRVYGVFCPENEPADVVLEG